MAFTHENQRALRILESIEQGSASAAESYRLIEDADPTLVYFIFTWLRKHYAEHPAAEGVIGRLVELATKYPALTRQLEIGKADAVVTWFEETHRYREFESREFIEVIVDKLEG